MKIICVIGSMGVGGGAERVMSYLCNYFSDRHSVVCLALSEHKGEKYYLRKEVKFINGIKYKNKLGAILVLRRLFLKEKPDLILSFLTQINISVLLATRFTQIPVIVSDRGNLAVKNMVRKYLRLWLYPKAAGVVFQTKDAQGYFKGEIYNKSVIIPNPVFVKEDIIKRVVVERKKEIVSVGRLDYQKNHEMTIRAFSKVHKHFPHYRLLIYGYGDKSEYQHLINTLGLNEHVVLCGNRSDVHECIKEAQLFVMSSRWEGMPNALMEAMALGLPCIATDCPVGAPKELIENGINGFLIPNEDEDALVDKMMYILNHTKEADAMGDMAQKIIMKYNVHTICNRWEKYLNDINNGTNTKNS